MNKIKSTIVLSALLFTQPISGFAANTNNMFGMWGSVTLTGDFKDISPSLEKFNWQVFNQTETRNDSSQGLRFNDNILFGHIAYQFNEHAALNIGYAHEWNDPLNKRSFQGSRPYQEFVWKQNLGDFKFMSRTRMEERINLTTGNDGYRARQLLRVNHPLPFMDGLSAYAGDEIMFYLNKNHFGKQGFSENRIFTGLSYQLNKKTGVDIGYMQQYIETISGSNVFIHNLQVNINYNF
ncbi:MAG: DUF2490 domain-containing protein [Methylococcaceae bacterium]|nr:DUF2490 domain-containing protein [Methylococcaceae bacterium]